MKPFFLSILLALSIAGCDPLQESHPAKVEVAPQEICALHHTPLITVAGFQAGKDVICIRPTQEYLRLSKLYPNRLNLYDSLNRSDLHSQPAQITYCPKCEAEAAAQPQPAKPQPNEAGSKEGKGSGVQDAKPGGEGRQGGSAKKRKRN